MPLASTRLWILGMLLFLASPTFAQNLPEHIQLAQQYAEQGELDKAVDMYQKTGRDADVFLEIYPEYKSVLRQLKDEKAEKNIIERAYDLSGRKSIYLFDLALMHLHYGKDKSAQKQFSKALNNLKESAYEIHQIAQNLIEQSQYEWAREVYLKGKSIFKKPEAFDLELAYIAGRMGETENMMQALVSHAQNYPEDIQNIKNLIDNTVLDQVKADILEEHLLKAIGRNKEAWALIDILAWLYNKQNDYASALDQLRSMDMLQQLDGSQILEHARLAYREKDYRTASRAYNYLIRKGSQYPYYATAMLEIIRTQKEIILQSDSMKQDDLLQLKKSYTDLIESNLNPYNTTSARIELAELEAKYLFQLDSAIQILEQLIADPRAYRELISDAKLALGDYYIMHGEHWESTLLYTQVEKDFKGTPTGEEAKFRNARLAYFKGDFDWALTILKVIKGNTFELISNDAILLATFISDNYHQDYEQDKAAMKSFSYMDLLFFQNRWEEAEKVADLMLLNYKGHPLEDDILFMKHKLAMQRRDYQTSEKFLLKVIQDFPKSYMTDHAVYRLAELYEQQLNQKDLAMTYYEKILTDYPDSIFIIDARKRYRLLRGDQID